VRETGLKVMLCPEMTYEIAVAKEHLFEPLPADVNPVPYRIGELAALGNLQVRVVTVPEAAVDGAYVLDVEVRNVKHLTNVIAALRATPAINSVERARG
jgi:hypothetical protein